MNEQVRYNHGIIEAKWLNQWEQEPSDPGVKVQVRLIPKKEAKLDLENARLLLLSHFLAMVVAGKEPCLSVVGASDVWFEEARCLGLQFGTEADTEGVVEVLPRDYVEKRTRDKEASQSYLCGRLMGTQGMYLHDLLPDFGVDAFRVYFFALGPFERDYRFNWHGLAGAHRFLSRFWQLAQTGLEEADHPMPLPEQLLELQKTVEARLRKRKPHTALAAIMGYLNAHSTLTRNEVRVLAELHKPFTPFLSAELLHLVATV